jgi:glycosyltransferase involved in cell wall biosynthesis
MKRVSTVSAHRQAALTIALSPVPTTRVGSLPADTPGSLRDLLVAVRHRRSPSSVVLLRSADDVGFGIAAAAIAALRPSQITTVEAATGAREDFTTASFSARYGAEVVKQFGGSVGVLATQSLLAGQRRASRKRPNARLERLAYLRPVVGSGLAIGGAFTHTYEVINALAKSGVVVDVRTNDRPLAGALAARSDGRFGVEVAEVPPWFRALPASVGGGADLTLLRTAVETASRSDLIYQRHSRFSVLGTLSARRTGTPLFLEYNGSENYFVTHWQQTPLQSRLAKLERLSLEAADRVFVVSEVIRDDLIESGYPDHKIVVNPNGVDPDRFDRGGGSQVRAELGIRPDEGLLGFIGSFGPWHGTTVLADAFERISELPDAPRLLVVGDGPMKDGFRSRLIQSVAWDRVIDRGRLDPTEIPAHLDACDVLLSPHCRIPGGRRFFGSPTKLFEYMAAGKAIVASDLEQIGDVLEDELSALLVVPDDPEALSAAILRCLREPELRQRLGFMARRRARERHSWARNAETIVSTYLAYAEDLQRRSCHR